MVPYRLLSPLFRKETIGLKDQKKNRCIANLSITDKNCFYAIDDVSKNIVINDAWLEYINHNQGIINGWMKHKLILYLQVKNPSVPNIPLKIEPPLSRNLTVANNYWKKVLENSNILDIYTSKPFTEENYLINGSLSIDHFIPWSFVLHDELWNLIPTFKNINSSKNDKLPKIDKYIDSFCEFQFNGIKSIKASNCDTKIFEEYINVLHNKNIEDLMRKGNSLEKGMFIDSLKGAITPLYHIAYNQGFEVWER